MFRAGLWVALVAVASMGANPYHSDIQAWGAMGFLSAPVTSFSIATGYVLARQADGKFVAWSHGMGAPCKACIIPEGLDSVVGFAAQNDRAFYLKPTGRMIAQPPLPAFTDTLPGIASIWGGEAIHAVDSSGRVHSYPGPKAPDSIRNVISVASGRYHAVALRRDGSIVAWGDNRFGQTKVPNGLKPARAIAAGELFSMALLADSTVVVWGDSTGPRTPFSTLRATAIAATRKLCLALRPDSTIAFWGVDFLSEATNIPTGLKVASLGGNYGVLVRLADGTLRTFGEPVWKTIPVGRSGVRGIHADVGKWYLDMENGAVFAGNDTLRSPSPNAKPARDLRPYLGCGAWVDGEGRLVMKSAPADWLARPEGVDTVDAALCNAQSLLLSRSKSPHVLRWGVEFWEGLAFPDTLPRLASFSPGDGYMLGLTQTGKVVGWGDIALPRFDSLPPMRELATGRYESYGLDFSGRVHPIFANGNSRGVPKAMPIGLENVVSLKAGPDHFLALREDGSVVGWGYDDFGQATPPSNLPPAKAIAAGESASMILLRDRPADTSFPIAIPIRRHRKAGNYQVVAVSLLGKRIWSGKATWSGSQWIGHLPKGTWMVAIPGERGSAALVTRMR